MRKARAAVDASSSSGRGAAASTFDNDVMLIEDSLPYGGDGMETQPYDNSEEAAKRFAARFPDPEEALGGKMAPWAD